MAEPAVDVALSTELTDAQRAVLEFERLEWRYLGAKEAAVMQRFGMTSTRYFQVVNALLDMPAAAAYDGQLVARLREKRDRRTIARRPARNLESRN